MGGHGTVGVRVSEGWGGSTERCSFHRKLRQRAVAGKAWLRFVGCKMVGGRYCVLEQYTVRYVPDSAALY